MKNRPTICRVCGCGLTEYERQFGRCKACRDYEEEKPGICEDREDGRDTITEFRRLEHGDPTLLASRLESMGITESGDDPADHEDNE